jgi:putative ABC transport system permease protein
MEDPAENERITEAIEAKYPELDCRGMNEIEATFGEIMGQVDLLLLMAVGLAFGVGAIGIANTMIMSTLERVPEFGVLRTNGWSSGQILKLVTLESLYLGVLAGLAGCLLAMCGCWFANFYLSDGIQLAPTFSILAKGLILSIITGAMAGIYPAWRASRWSPMEAIRYDP